MRFNWLQGKSFSCLFELLHSLQPLPPRLNRAGAKSSLGGCHWPIITVPILSETRESTPWEADGHSRSELREVESRYCVWNSIVISLSEISVPCREAIRSYRHSVQHLPSGIKQWSLREHVTNHWAPYAVSASNDISSLTAHPRFSSHCLM